VCVCVCLLLIVYWSGACPFPGSHCPFPGILVLSTEVVDGQPHVLHLRWSIASWLNTRSLLHVGHCGEKNCVDKISKNLVAIATSLEWSQPNFTAIICAHMATNAENFVKIGLVLSEITWLELVVKTGSSFGSYGQDLCFLVFSSLAIIIIIIRLHHSTKHQC